MCVLLPHLVQSPLALILGVCPVHCKENIIDLVPLTLYRLFLPFFARIIAVDSVQWIIFGLLRVPGTAAAAAVCTYDFQ